MAVSTFFVGEIDTVQDYRIEALCISSLCATCKYCYYTLKPPDPPPPLPPPPPTVNQSRQERGEPTALLKSKRDFGVYSSALCRRYGQNERPVSLTSMSKSRKYARTVAISTEVRNIHSYELSLVNSKL